MSQRNAGWKLRIAGTGVMLFSGIIGFVSCTKETKTPETSAVSSSTSSTTVAVALSGTRFCGGMAEPVQVGSTQDPALLEISGVVASRRHEGVFWVHNDSGDSARIFAINLAGERLGEFILEGVEANDFEDITIMEGEGAEVGSLVIADIGDNFAVRPEVELIYLSEPDLPLDPTAPVSISGLYSIWYEYSDGPRDAESIFVDSATSELAIISKDYFDTQGLYTPAKAADGVLAPINRVGPVQLGKGQVATSADADETAVLVRTYTDVLVFDRQPNETLESVLSREPCAAPSAKEQQGEAIALLADGSGYVTISEGLNAPIWLVKAR